MSPIYLPWNASKARQQDAERARQHRAEIVRELSWGRVSRRDLIKMGLFTSAGMLAPIGGLSPFVGTASADEVNIPTGAPRSPLFGAKPFTQAMPRVDVLPRNPVSSLTPDPRAESNQTLMPVDPLLGGGYGPIEGRPPGSVWAHQRWDEFFPQTCVEATTAPAMANDRYNPQVASSLNSGIDPTQSMPVRFHRNMPNQNPDAMWMFNATMPPKLVQVKYGEPILFRHHNGLRADVRLNGGFGRHTLSTHEHNGHHGAENDGFAGAYFFPQQFYDYHWPIVLAGHFSLNKSATDRMASSPDGSGGLTNVPGDWHETMSSHWFHDHMFGFTSDNVYKGNTAVFNIYSGLDRGNEDIDDGVNLRLPSGSAKDWGNLDYDVNLMLTDNAFDRDGQLYFDIFNFDGFLGDVVTTNFAYKPYFEVERRKYRFRLLNTGASRFFKVALADVSGRAQPIIQIANDGNLLPAPVTLLSLDELGPGERYDIVIDFSNYRVRDRLHLVNLAEHEAGRGPKEDLSMAEALSGTSRDPGVGRFLEFRIVREPAKPDTSRVPVVMIPNPDLSKIPVARERTFVFGRGAKQPGTNPFLTLPGPWGISTDGGRKLDSNIGNISAAPKFGTREVWHLVNDGGGWDHPIHVHFEEGQILARNGRLANVALAERGRKDVYRLRKDGVVTVSLQFRDWGGMFMEHCHNLVHEDNAMLLRWDINTGGEPFLRPLPTPIPTPQGVTFEDPTFESEDR